MTTNLYLAERNRQRAAVFVFCLFLGGTSFAFQNQRELFSARSAAPAAPAALTAFVPAPVETGLGTSRILRVPTRFAGIPQSRRAPVTALLPTARQLPQAFPLTDTIPVDPPAPTAGTIPVLDEPAATDIPGIVSNNSPTTPPTPPTPPQGTVDQAEQAVPAGAVPEPSTWVMLVFGFLVAGGSLRRSPAKKMTGMREPV